jgi:2-polyprenyl-6-hydroxyphenyl methylase/3-demethylubiquinone-9 3-methyltransferase
VTALSPSAHEAEVAARFDQLQARFKTELGPCDVRLEALRGCLGPVKGLRVLDLGCGKGRFAAPLANAGATVIGLDRSSAMLAAAPARGVARVHGSASRLPFVDASFGAMIAVEVFEHLTAIDSVLAEVRRILRPGGTVAILDKNAGSWNAQRPWLPNLAVKRIDEARGLWMYPRGGPVRERWLWPGNFARHLRRYFTAVRVTHLLTPAEEKHLLFRAIPAARVLALWSARVPGGACV